MANIDISLCPASIPPFVHRIKFVSETLLASYKNNCNQYFVYIAFTRLESKSISDSI